MILRTDLSHRVLLAAGALLLLACRAPAFDAIIDSPMYRSPDLPPPTVTPVFPRGLKELWLQALKRPEAEMRLKAADAIALAHQRGVPGMDGTIDPLVAALAQPEQHPAVRLAAARTLIALDARRSAASLFGQLQSGDVELRNLIEPALARWDHRPARALWLERLELPKAPPRSLTLAIQGLGIVGEDKAVDRLRALVHGPTIAAPIRLEAARALGAIRTEGLVPDAQKLAADDTERGLIGRLAAAHLLQRHKDPAAIALLQRLVRDREPAVAVVAGARLLAIDANLLIGSIDHLTGSADPGVRSLAVDVLYRVPTKSRLRMLSERLADVHRGVRRKARAQMQTLAVKPALRPHVIDDAMRVLAAEDWRGQEQAAILLTELDHKPAAQRCVALLDSSRPEVFVTAAWALRRLAVQATLEPVLEYVHAEFERVKTGQLPGPANLFLEPVDHKLSQLCQLLGQQKYTAADKVLRKFVPKRTTPGGEARGAAVWALGLLLEGKADAGLASELAARVDDHGIPPEDQRVCWMAAVTLGRMKASSELPTLRKYWNGRVTSNPIENACGWAVAQITGEPMPAPEPIRRVERDWFLLPQQ